MTVTMSVAQRPVQRFGWSATVVLHLLPAAVAIFVDKPWGFAAVVTVQLVVLLHAARWSWEGVSGLLSFRRRLPSRMYVLLLPSLVAIALGVALLLDVEPRAGWLLAAAAVQEVYFRAYLLPRLPVDGARAVVASAGLSALTFGHLFVFAFLVQLVLTAVAVRFDSVRVSIAAYGLLALAVFAL